MADVLSVIEFEDDQGDTLVKRIPEGSSSSIKWGAQLTVRESQKAVFFRDGQSLDVFGPGRHVLKTQNIPLLTKAITSLGYGTDSPFRAEVYFLSMKLFPNFKWGTKEPIVFRDSELKMIRLRGNGAYSIQIQDPQLFLNKVVGTKGLFKERDISDYLRSIIVTHVTKILGEQYNTIFELPSSYQDLSTLIRNSLKEDFDGLGLSLHDFYVNSISVPPAVQELIDKKSGMGAVGDMDEFMKYQTGISLESAAENSDGSAGTGVGVGAGMGMGFMMPQYMQQSFNQQSPNPSGGQGNENSSESTEKDEGASAQDDPFEKVKKLKELLDMDAISQEEFDEAKKKLLNNI